MALAAIMAAMELTAHGDAIQRVRKIGGDEINGNVMVVVDVDLSGLGSGLGTNEVRSVIDSSFSGGTQKVNLVTGAFGLKRDRDDLRVYRKVKDCWTWTDWPNDWATTNAPADFIKAANSPGAVPLEYRLGAWDYASQFWPNGNLKYDASFPPGSAHSGSDLVLNFRFVARAEDGHTELFRFGATATRTNATSEVLVDWFKDGPAGTAPVRIPTSDLVALEISSATCGLRRVDGAARPLPKYLHALDFADSYTNESAAYYRSRGNGTTGGGCSSVRDGGFLYRNFDYPFDDRAEFVVKMAAGKDRFASVGVAQIGTNLTEQMVTSGDPKYSLLYNWLPGATVDGINENGVACNINVVDGDPQTSGWHTNATSDATHPIAAIRWILDHATNAQHAAAYIAANIRFPHGWTQNFHYMIADAEKTYIVENGLFRAATWDDGMPPVMTNFPLFSGESSDGTGEERYLILADRTSITNVWYTNAYLPSTQPPWVSDFNDNFALYEAATNRWAKKPKEEHRGEIVGGQSWWQTVHTSIYDITNRVLRVAVQEKDDWYTFQVPRAGGGGTVDAYTKSQTDGLLAGKANKNGDDAVDFHAKELTVDGINGISGLLYVDADMMRVTKLRIDSDNDRLYVSAEEGRIKTWGDVYSTRSVAYLDEVEDKIDAAAAVVADVAQVATNALNAANEAQATAERAQSAADDAGDEAVRIGELLGDFADEIRPKVEEVAQVATNALDAASAAQETADGKVDAESGNASGLVCDNLAVDRGTFGIAAGVTVDVKGARTLAEYGLSAAATNAAAAVFAAGADYALSSVTLPGGIPASLLLASGEMINVTVPEGVTRINLGIESKTGRSMDALLRVVCGQTVTLGIDGVGSVAVVDGTGWGEIPAGTNYVTITKTAEVGGKAVLLVNVKEIK